MKPLSDPVGPLAAIAADAVSPQAIEAAARIPWTSSAWGRLRAPSPRSIQELEEDMFAQLLNGALDAKTQSTASTEAHVGEATMDCVYALVGTDGGSGESPIGRLWRSALAFLGKLRKRNLDAAQQAARAAESP